MFSPATFITNALADLVLALSSEREAHLHLLSQALEAMHADAEQHVDGDGGALDLSCGNCLAAIPTPHSLGCRIDYALWAAKAGVR